MRKTVVLTPFHEEYLANTVAQVKDLLWAQFEKENKKSLKDETYLYKNEDIIYQDRIVAEDQNYRDLLKYILEGGKIKFQKEKLAKKEVDASFWSILRRPVTVYSEDGEPDGSYWDLGELDRHIYDKLDPLCASINSNRRSVLSLVEYPESWTFIYKKSRIGFQDVATKKQTILKIFNRNSTSEKKGYSTNEGLFKLKITKSGFVRYFNGQSCRWLSLKNWHNTKLPFGEEVLRLLVSINPNNEFLRKEQKNFYFTKYNIANKNLRKSTSWKSFYKAQVGFYKEHIPLVVAKDIATKIPQLEKREAFFNRIQDSHLPKIVEDKYTPDNHKEYFEKTYATLLTNDVELQWNSNHSHIHLVSDAYRMAKDLDEEFNFKIESAKKFKEYHDDLAKRHRLRELGPLKPHEKFKILKSGKYEVEYIETSERLVQEAVELHHCVSSYASSINSGHCGIYSIWDGEKRWTCELQYSLQDWKRYRFVPVNNDPSVLNIAPEQEIVKKGFFIQQCRGLHNKNAPKEVVDFIQEQLDEVNKGK